jgi:protein-tyrosine kinase
MDRIKQALDKARAERLLGEPRESDLLPAGGESASQSGIRAAEIKYSQTKVHELDPATLRKNRVIYGDADRQGLAAYKLLRTQVMQRMAARDWNVLAITSPAVGDGKTVTSINLAISLARELHRTVLLVDMDLRNPSVGRYFGLAPEKGISDYLLGDTPLSEVLINPGIERLVVLPGRSLIENSSEVLASPAMGRLVTELKSRYPSRIVLFDLPPVLSADDALSFAPFVDAFLLVLRDGKNTRDEVAHTLEVMKEATILGTVLNDSPEQIAGYY